ncbi:U3 small nucleolar ribonucleoprotein complex subunit Mpp10 [Trinorchestia longiramus]|nr:U3 small nucleolar ribonucleoprotein complex subunit Mpp10 [Trinorchestia longiramus]
MLRQKLEKYFSKVEDFVGEKKDKAEHLQLCQQIHDIIREQEKLLGLQKPKTALLHLYIDGMDHDQIAQELAANEEELLATEGDAAGSLMHQTSELMCLLETSPTDLQVVYDIPLQIPNTEQKQSERKRASLVEKDGEGYSCNGSDGSEEEESDEEVGDGNKSSTDEGLAVSGEDDNDNTDEEEQEESENDLAGGSDDQDEEDSEEEDDGNNRDERDSHEGSDEDSDVDSDDSAYAELDKQLFQQYMVDEDKKSDEDDDPIEDLAGASESDSDDEPRHKIEEEDVEDQEEQSSDDGGKSHKKKKNVRFNINSSSKINNQNPLQKVQLPNFSHCSVDSQFFNVRESEYIADQDLIGTDNFKDIDFMEDIPDDEDHSGGEKATYRDFFDDVPPPGTSSENASSQDNWGLGNKNDRDDGDDDEAAPESAQDQDEPMNTSATDQVKSRFELELEAENKLRKELEEKNISEKPWMLQGEVRAQDRPTNSVLTEYLEFASGAKLRPIINEELCSRVERIVLDRFRSKAFDDVERKAKLVDDPFEYKKKIVLDQEKSSKSLSKIYEEEYLKKQRLDSAQKAEEELPEHKKIRLAYEELEDYLDALSNTHYTPKLKHPELKIMSNLPAMQLEENTPVVANDSDLLAPQEVAGTVILIRTWCRYCHAHQDLVQVLSCPSGLSAAPVRGLLKGDTEKTTTDRKRQRRTKKYKQHLKYERQQQNVSNKVKKAAKDGKRLDVNTSAKVVQTALKSGKVKKMDSNGPNIKSSTAFFKQLGEQHDSASAKHASKKRKRGDTR